MDISEIIMYDICALKQVTSLIKNPLQLLAIWIGAQLICDFWG